MVAQSSEDSDEGTWHPRHEESSEDEEEEEEEVDDEVTLTLTLCFPWHRPDPNTLLIAHRK